jgi:hypothetical protein
VTEFWARVLGVLRHEGADVAENLGIVAIGIGVVLFLASMPWPIAVTLALCVGVRLHRRAENTAELDRYRRGRL